MRLPKTAAKASVISLGLTGEELIAERRRLDAEYRAEITDITKRLDEFDRNPRLLSPPP
jgi:hypothetical protein